MFFTEFFFRSMKSKKDHHYGVLLIGYILKVIVLHALCKSVTFD